MTVRKETTMPPRLTKPTDLDPSRQAFVDMMWQFFIAARRPSMIEIAATIKAWPEKQRTGSANHETVRRILRGESVGSLQTAEMVFLALCQIADVDPDDADDDDGDRWSSAPPHAVRFRQLWHEAVDGAPMPSLPRTRTERDRAEQESAAARATAARAWSSGEEPPF